MAQILSKEKIQGLYEKALEVLEKIGVAFDTPQAIQLFSSHGFHVENGRVFFTAFQVEEALKYAAVADYNDLSSKRIVATSPFGNVPMLYDFETNAYRSPNLEDAVRMYKLVQTSDLYECANPGLVEPLGLEGEDTYISQIALLLSRTDKWLSNGMRATVRNARGGNLYQAERDMIRMVKRFRGEDGVVMGQGICPMSPLRYDIECLENLTAAVDEGQNIGLYPCSLTGMTGPSALIDQVLHDVALSLAGIVYITLKNPEIGISLAPSSGATDMRCMQATYGTPEAAYLSAMFYEFCKYYKLSCSICATLADSALPDYQGGCESMLSTLAPYIITDVDVLWASPGHMAAWYCGSFEKMIYDEELIRSVNHLLKGVCTDVTPGLLGTLPKAIEKNTFMTGRTQKEYRRDHYLSKIFSKHGVPKDLPPEKTDIRLRAKTEIKRREDEYQLPEWTSEQKRILNEYLPSKYKI